MSVLASKCVLAFCAVMQLMAGAWAAGFAFGATLTTEESSGSNLRAVAMMGMLGSFFHSVVILVAILKFRAEERRILALSLPAWHVPEALLIATLGMGVPVEDQPVGIGLHALLGGLALTAAYLEGQELKKNLNHKQD